VNNYLTTLLVVCSLARCISIMRTVLVEEKGGMEHREMEGAQINLTSERLKGPCHEI
jgi:hypothetical protein